MVSKKNKKRILSVMLSILSCLFLFAPVVPYAEIQKQGKCGEKVEWILDEGTLKISGTGAMYDFDKDSAPWIGNGVKKVVIEKGVTKIGSYSFYNCYGLAEVTIPNDSVVMIGKHAFDGCERLGSITLPVSVTEIQDGAFCGCKELKVVTIPHNVHKVGQNLFNSSGVNEVFALKDLNLTVPADATLYGYETTGAMKDGVIEVKLNLQYEQAAPKYAISKSYKFGVSYSYDNLGKKETIGSVIQYVADDGTVSRVIDPSSERVAWVRLNGKWYGLDIKDFQAGDVFRIKLADDATLSKLDANHKNAAAENTLRAFTIELRHPDGTLCTDHPKPFDLYVQYDDKWADKNIRAVCIDDGKDVSLDVNAMDWGMKNSAAKIKVAKLTLNKFGSFAIYLDNGTGGQGENSSYKTADIVTNNMLFGLPALMLVALGGVYISLKKKRTK